MGISLDDMEVGGTPTIVRAEGGWFAYSVINRDDVVVQPVLAWRIGSERSAPVVLDRSIAIDAIGSPKRRCFYQLLDTGDVFERFDDYCDMVDQVLDDRGE